MAKMHPATREKRINYLADAMRDDVFSEFLRRGRDVEEVASRMRIDQTDGIVYFVQCGDGGPIKLGHTRHDINKRLAALQTANPFLLTARRTIPGSRRLESMLHKHFARDIILGEWFVATEELAAMCGGTPTPAEFLAGGVSNA